MALKSTRLKHHPCRHFSNRHSANIVPALALPNPEGPLEASHSMEASHLSATGWNRGGLQGGSPGGLWCLVSSESTLLSPNPPLGLLTFCFTGSGL